MASGLQVWDGQGRNTFDTNTNTSRVLGVVTGVGVNSQSGSIYDARFATGRGFYIVSPKSVGSNSYGYPYIASIDIRIQNSTLSWTVYFSGDNPNNDCGSIIYGVF